MARANQSAFAVGMKDHSDRKRFVWSEESLRHIFENSLDAILLIDDARIVDCNRAAINMLGYSRAGELLSVSLNDLLPAMELKDSGRANQLISRALENGSQRFEWTMKRKDKSELPVEALLTPFPHQERQILHAVLRDISRRKEAEQRLLTEREREDEFRAGQSDVLEMIARGETIETVLASLVWLIEAQAEGMLCSVLQLSEDGKHVRHGAGPSLPQYYIQAVDGAPIGPKNGSCGTAMFLARPVIVTDMLTDPLWEDYRELAKLSGLRACWSTPIFSGNGTVLGSFAMYYREPQAPTGSEARLTEVATHIAGIAIEHANDLTRRRRAEEQLAHVARVTTMGELAASIAHEVNQPLGAIVGNADICLNWLEADKPDLIQLREAIEDIAADGRRASQVISRIRSLVKKQMPEKMLLDLSDVAREVLDLIAHEAQRRQVMVLPELGESLPVVAADRVQLQQVFLNLLMNGIEAMRGIEGRKTSIALKTDRFESGVLATVSDSGVGIDPAKAGQLFEPFHTTKSGGMGMGLPISRSIIEAHGGKIWAESNSNGGATFKFTLPMAGKDAL